MTYPKLSSKLQELSDAERFEWEPFSGPFVRHPPAPSDDEEDRRPKRRPRPHRADVGDLGAGPGHLRVEAQEVRRRLRLRLLLAHGVEDARHVELQRDGTETANKTCFIPSELYKWASSRFRRVRRAEDLHP